MIFKKRFKFNPVFLLGLLFFVILIFLLDVLGVKIFNFHLSGAVFNGLLLFLSGFLGKTGLILLLSGFEVAILFSMFDISVILPKIKLKKERQSEIIHEGEKRIEVREKIEHPSDNLEKSHIKEREFMDKQIIHREREDTEVPLVLSKEVFLNFLSIPKLEKRDSSTDIKIKKAKLIRKLREFGVKGNITSIKSGPFITRFDFKPAAGEKINSIIKLADDLALELGVGTISIVGPQPGKDVLGIEVPNDYVDTVFLRPLLESKTFIKEKRELVFPVGTDIEGNPVVWSVTDFPHLLIAGTTGSGKSVFLNSLIVSLLYNNSYENLRLILIDPKRIEMQFYNYIPHLLIPVVVDPREAVSILDYAVNIMEERYREFSRAGVRNIKEFNRRSQDKKPYILIVVDELADLMMTSSREVERGITRLAQMARAVGIHLVLATQRPSVDVITGIIKANFPSRIAFKVSSKVDSKVILDTTGAERLLGRGDMLFLPFGRGEPVRLHAPYISADEVKGVCKYLGRVYMYQRFSPHMGMEMLESIMEEDIIEGIIFKDDPLHDIKRKKLKNIVEDELYKELIDKGIYAPFDEVEYTGASQGDYSITVDELFEKAAELVYEMGGGSASLLQRRFSIGWARAIRIVDQLEAAGILGGPERGGKPRKVLVKSREELEERIKKALNR